MRSHGLRNLFTLLSLHTLYTTTSPLPINDNIPQPSLNDIQTLYPAIDSVFQPLCKRNNKTNIWKGYTLQFPGQVPDTPTPVPTYAPLPVEVVLDGTTPVSCQSVGLFAFQRWNIAEHPVANSQTICLPGAHKYALTVTLEPIPASPLNLLPGLPPLTAPGFASIKPWYSQPGGVYTPLQTNSLNDNKPPDPQKFRIIGELSWELPANTGGNDPHACMNVHFEFDFTSGVGFGADIVSGGVALWDVPGSQQPDGGGYSNNLPENSLVESTGTQ